MTDWYLRPQTLAKVEIQQAESVGHDCSQLRQRLDAIPEDDLTRQQIAEAEGFYLLDLSVGGGQKVGAVGAVELPRHLVCLLLN